MLGQAHRGHFKEYYVKDLWFSVLSYCGINFYIYIGFYCATVLTVAKCNVLLGVGITMVTWIENIVTISYRCSIVISNWPYLVLFLK